MINRSHASVQLYPTHLHLTCTPSPLYLPLHSCACNVDITPFPYTHCLPHTCAYFFFPLTHPHMCVNASPKLGLHVNVHPPLCTHIAPHSYTYDVCIPSPPSLSTPSLSTLSLHSFQSHFLSHSLLMSHLFVLLPHTSSPHPNL